MSSIAIDVANESLKISDYWMGTSYDPAEGDAEKNIPIGTAFEDLPEDWVCPLCGAEKAYFEELED